MHRKPGSLLGGTLLIGGSCVGAGILGLPIVTGLSGFYPSIIMLVAAWAFMTATALLVLEVNGWFTKDVNYISMVGHSLGRWGQRLSWLLYLFLFYSLLVAYQAGIGIDISSTVIRHFSFHISPWIGTFFFVLLFGCLLYSGTRTVDICNRVLMAGKILAYLGIVAVGLLHINPTLLKHTDAHYLFYSLPILVISFGFHNMIPTITTYMAGDLKRVRIVIITGSLFALVVYLLWDLIVLGIVPIEGEYGIIAILHAGQDASQSIAGILGASWVTHFAGGLAFFSLLTSLLLQSLALTHFLADGLQTKDREPLSLLLLTLIPPFFFSILKPDIFFKALDFAGGICAVVLFGILPVLMVWIGRYRKRTASTYQMKGGKPVLAIIFLFAAFIFLFQLSTMAGLFPTAE
ncbi:MAG: tyrP 1 [Parachlamydiales bacterium]|nr:tyrP 1 [Parachlamydiales bacterium]